MFKMLTLTLQIYNFFFFFDQLNLFVGENDTVQFKIVFPFTESKVDFPLDQT